METHLRTITTTKRSLAALCAAMEASIDASHGRPTPDSGPVVVAMFQRRAYFEQSRQRYASLAAHGIVCVVAFTGDCSDLPPGVHGVCLEPTEALANEWSLVVIDGELGATLVAWDLGDIVPGEDTFEAGRLFTANWGFSAARAAAEGRRIVDGLGPRLDSGARARILAAIRAAADVEPSDVERRLADMSELLVQRVDRANNRSSRLNSQLRRERDNAERDPMTGLHNRRFLERYLRSPVERAPVSVATLLVDLDNLKEINDTFGHTAGDAAITAVARALREVTRPQDVVVRLGGDEFLAVIPGQSSASGLRVAERVIDYVSRIRLPEPWQEIAISVSVGVSSSEPHHIPLERLDTALYAAKRTGKGRACLLEVA